MYKHYVRPSTDTIIRYGFCDIQEDSQFGDILIDDNAPRQFNLQLQNDKGQYMYKAVNGALTLRTDTELFDLLAYKQEKINLLSGTCNKTILSGFSSIALGVSHTYDFDEEAQRNLSGRLGLINANTNYPASFNWKTIDVGVLAHTKAQFIQLCTDADTFKDTQVEKYWNLKSQVNAVTTDTKAKVDVINW